MRVPDERVFRTSFLQSIVNVTRNPRNLAAGIIVLYAVLCPSDFCLLVREEINWDNRCCLSGGQDYCLFFFYSSYFILHAFPSLYYLFEYLR